MASLVLLGLAPAATAAPRPGFRVETPVRSTAPDRRLIRETYIRQYEPLPASVPAHPAACDWLGYLRFRHRDGPSRPSRADAVLVVMPGFLGGASLHDTLARNVIRRAARSHAYVELWALDRRANCVEDNTGVRAGSRSRRGYRRALDYYYRGREVEGRRFAGYRSSDDVPYLAEFGLAQTMRDEFAVIRRGIPDPRIRKRKVFCGGHSLGGLLTGAFASWDFDGDPETTADAGYNQCAGYFALDSIVSNSLGGLPTLGPVGDALYTAGRVGTRSGALPRYATSLPPLTPELFQVVGVLGLAAYQAPEGAGLLRSLPRTADIDLALRYALSRNAAAFATGEPSPREFRLTNEALLGALTDENSIPIPSLQASVGTFDGGPVVEKDFLLPNVLRDLPLVGESLAELQGGGLIVPGTSKTRLMIPARQGPLYRWREYDRMAAPDAPRQADGLGRPFTSPRSEVTDIHQFARSLFEGPTNAWEQYFPLRLTFDTFAFVTGGRAHELSSGRYADGPRRRPYLELLAGEGGGGSIGVAPLASGAQPRRRVVLPGYTHLDVAAADRRQNGGRLERSSASLTRFVLDVIGKSVRRSAAKAPGSRSHRRSRAWYVRAAAPRGGDGSRNAPFSSLARVERAAARGDTIVVLPAPRGVAPLDGGIALKPHQRLIGAGPSVRSRPPPRRAPRITNTNPSRHSGDVVRLADHVTVRNLEVSGSYRGAIYGKNVTGVRVHGNDVSGYNTSCAEGFHIPAFTFPINAPGVGFPISGGVPNGWAGIMVDESRGERRISIRRNLVRDARCGDGIDLRLMGTAEARAEVTGNVVKNLKREDQPLCLSSNCSVLAIGLQTLEQSRLVANLDRNRQTNLGNQGDAEVYALGTDTEGVFANLGGSSEMTVTVNHNTYTNPKGLGGFSANGMELVNMGDSSRVRMLIRNSTFSGTPGDILEEINLGRNSRMSLVLDHVVATGSIGPGNTVLAPGNNSDCLLAGSTGAGNTVELTIRDSRLTNCANNGLSVGSNVVNGSGPTARITVDISGSEITGNRGANLGFRNFTGLTDLSVKIEDTDLSDSRGLGSGFANVEFEDLGSTAHSEIDLGGGALGSTGNNCITGGMLAAELTRYSVAAEHNWWGSATGPGLGRTLTVGGSLDYEPPLSSPASSC